MTFITYTTALTFLLIALTHFIWGSYLLARPNEISLARAVVSARGITQMPNFWACSFVALALIIRTLIVLRLGGVVAIVELATPIFIREGVNILGNDMSPVALTPDMQADKIVLLEFRDDAHMDAFFKLPDYIEAAKHRLAASKMSGVKFERFAP